jgi:hypothetical protein
MDANGRECPFAFVRGLNLDPYVEHRFGGTNQVQQARGSAEVLPGGLAPPEAKFRERKEAAQIDKQKEWREVRSQRPRLARTFFLDFLAFSRLMLNFPFRRHKAAGDGRQTLTGRT